MDDLTRNILDNNYFRLPKFWASGVGLWPFLSTFRKNSLRILVLVIMWHGVPPMIAAPFSADEDYIDTVILVIPPVCTIGVSTLKYCNLIVNERAIRELLLKIQQDHLISGRTIGRQHLLDFSEIGRKFSYFYSTYLLVSMVLFLLFPYTPIFLDIINPLNETRTLHTLFPAEYGIDKDKYYIVIMINQSIYASVTIFAIICCDILFMTFIFHACGLFAVVCYNLCHFTDDLKTSASYNLSEGNVSERICTNATEIFNKRLAHCLMLHNEAIEYADNVRQCFTKSLSAIVVLNMVVLSLTGFQLVMKQDQWDETVTAAIYTLAQLLHMFTLSLPGQFLINMSETIGEAIYDSNWYNIPSKTQKLLLMVLIRARSPCFITAGNYFILRLDTFGSILQTSLSYFTVLANTR